MGAAGDRPHLQQVRLQLPCLHAADTPLPALPSSGRCCLVPHVGWTVPQSPGPRGEAGPGPGWVVCPSRHEQTLQGWARHRVSRTLPLPALLVSPRPATPRQVHPAHRPAPAGQPAASGTWPRASWPLPPLTCCGRWVLCWMPWRHCGKLTGPEDGSRWRLLSALQCHEQLQWQWWVPSSRPAQHPSGSAADPPRGPASGTGCCTEQSYRLPAQPAAAAPRPHPLRWLTAGWATPFPAPALVRPSAPPRGPQRHWAAARRAWAVGRRGWARVVAPCAWRQRWRSRSRRSWPFGQQPAAASWCRRDECGTGIDQEDWNSVCAATALRPNLRRELEVITPFWRLGIALVHMGRE